MTFKNNENLIGILLAALFGIAVWVIFWLSEGKSDPQSTLPYWKIGYPLLIVASSVLGYFFHEQPWRWGTVIILSQVFLGIFTNSGDWNQLPIGLAVHVVIAIPLIFDSYLWRWIRKTHDMRA